MHVSLPRHRTRSSSATWSWTSAPSPGGLGPLIWTGTVAILTAVLTHLDAASIGGPLSYLRSLAPESRFVVCHGGKRTDFEALPPGDAVFVDDPSLRGPHFDQSMNAILGAVYEGSVRDDPSVELIYLIEYDHLILRGDFERTLRELASQSARDCSPRTRRRATTRTGPTTSGSATTSG